MDAEQQKALKTSLTQEKTDIEAELAKFAKRNPAIKGDWTSVVNDNADASDSLDDKAHEVTDYEERRAVEQNLELRLKQIEETLYKIDAGTYGICSNCSLPIEPTRLLATPAVRHCFSCASKITLT